MSRFGGEEFGERGFEGRESMEPEFRGGNEGFRQEFGEGHGEMGGNARQEFGEGHGINGYDRNAATRQEVQNFLHVAPQKGENEQRMQEGQALRERFQNRPAEQNLKAQVQNRPAEQNLKAQVQNRPAEQNLKAQVQKIEAPEAANTKFNAVKAQGFAQGGLVRQNIAGRHPNWNNWFNNKFWYNHNYFPRYPYYGYGAFWGALGWGAVAAWLPWLGDNYYYYDNGSAYYQLPSGVYQTMPVAPFDYSQTVEDISSLPAPASTNEEDWLPLGIYALTSSSQSAAAPNMYMQLALNKEGTIEGTLYNTTLDKLYPVDGYVSKDTQRAVLQVSGAKDSPVVETGLYNLTEDQTSVQMHFADGQTQDWLMVRLKNKD